MLPRISYVIIYTLKTLKSSLDSLVTDFELLFSKQNSYILKQGINLVLIRVKK